MERTSKSESENETTICEARAGVDSARARANVSQTFRRSSPTTNKDSSILLLLPSIVSCSMPTLHVTFQKQQYPVIRRTRGVVNGNVVVFRIHGFFHKGLVNDDTIDRNVVVEFLHLHPVAAAVVAAITVAITVAAAAAVAHGCRCCGGGRRNVTVARHVHVPRHVNARRFQQVVDLAAVLQYRLLNVQVVENVRLAQRRVLDGLLQRKALAEKGNEDVDHGPLLDGRVQNGVVAKKHNLEYCCVAREQQLCVCVCVVCTVEKVRCDDDETNKIKSQNMKCAAAAASTARHTQTLSSQSKSHARSSADGSSANPAHGMYHMAIQSASRGSSSDATQYSALHCIAGAVVQKLVSTHAYI